jgi:hypothetical protein
MLLCCRDSAGIIDDVQDSMDDVKLETIEADKARRID